MKIDRFFVETLSPVAFQEKNCFYVKAPMRLAKVRYHGRDLREEMATIAESFFEEITGGDRGH